MSAPAKKIDSWLPWQAAGGALLAGLLLLAAFGFDFSTKLVFWRDHPFDRENLRFAAETFSFRTRLWAYDPMHLFGWTPNVFYNPLASLSAGLFARPFSYSAGSYLVWLLGLLWLTGLAGWAFLPRNAGRAAWLAGAGVIGLLSWMIYPTDAGIIDANPVQVLYTGQWAQRLGIAFGLVALERFWRALQAWDERARRVALESLLAAATLWGMSLFSHFMSGYATGLALGLLSLHHLCARGLLGKSFGPAPLVLLLAGLATMGLLFADFFFAFFALQGDFHHLPLLRWKLPGAAYATVHDVLVPALPLLLMPALAMLARGARDGVALGRAGLPIVVLTAAVSARPDSMLPWALTVIAAGLAAVRLERRSAITHWLPGLAFGLWTLACGPDSLRAFGLDLSSLMPFSASLGFAKLAAFARIAFMAWLGLLAAESLAELSFAGLKLKSLAWSLVVLGLSLPLGLALSAEKGAHSFFAWVAETDEQATSALQTHMERVAGRLAPDAYPLIEDPLHHAPGSELSGRRLPNGHLVYSTGPALTRPVLGGAVTTRYLTHPHAQTARGQLLCRDFKNLQAADVERLRDLGISDLLVHSPELIESLRGLPEVERIDSVSGLTHFRLRRPASLLRKPAEGASQKAELRWRKDGLEIGLPPGEPESLRLRLVHIPWLACEPAAACRLSSWRQGAEEFSGCDLAGGREFYSQPPWLQVDRLQSGGPLRIELRSRPPLWPWILTLLTWTAAGFWRYAWPRLKRKATESRAA